MKRIIKKTPLITRQMTMVISWLHSQQYCKLKTIIIIVIIVIVIIVIVILVLITIWASSTVSLMETFLWLQRRNHRRYILKASVQIIKILIDSQVLNFIIIIINLLNYCIWVPPIQNRVNLFSLRPSKSARSLKVMAIQRRSQKVFRGMWLCLIKMTDLLKQTIPLWCVE